MFFVNKSKLNKKLYFDFDSFQGFVNSVHEIHVFRFIRSDFPLFFFVFVNFRLFYFPSFDTYFPTFSFLFLTRERSVSDLTASQSHQFLGIQDTRIYIKFTTAHNLHSYAGTTTLAIETRSPRFTEMESSLIRTRD